MPKPSDHDLVVEKKRDEARQALIDHYIQIAIANSEDYGFLNVMGHEVPDPTVVEPPLGYVAQPDLMEMMRRMIRNTISDIAEDTEFETFEEADDFDIDDDPVDYSSPYEEFFDPAPGAPAGPPPDPNARPDPNAAPPAAPEAGGGGAQPPGGQPNETP